MSIRLLIRVAGLRVGLAWLIELVPVLGLRVATVLYNCQPMLRDIVKVRFIATNYGEKQLRIVRSVLEGRERDDVHAENHSITLLPGESSEFSTFRSWDVPGEYQLTMAYEGRCAGLPFARLHYPTVTIYVRRRLTPRMLLFRAAHLLPRRTKLLSPQ